MNNMLHDCRFILSQDNDTMQGNDEGQLLTVEFITPDGSEHFCRITTTKSGWSFDDPEELAKCLRSLANAVEDVKKGWEKAE